LNKLSGAAGNAMVAEIYTSKSVLCTFYLFHTCFLNHSVVHRPNYIEINLSRCSSRWESLNKLSGAASNGMIDEIYKTVYLELLTFSLCFTRGFCTIALCNGRVILKTIYSHVALGETHWTSYLERQVMRWLLKFTRRSLSYARFICFTLFLCRHVIKN